MRNFRSISINTKDKTAWVEVGTTLGQLYYTIARHSRTLAFTAGVCPTVGVGGHISGGGYGMMSRKHSIAADHIIDAKVMNADGHIVDRRSMGEDLFWAIRGGGGTSFGIVLAFKLELITVPETVTVFNVSRTLEQNATHLVHRWQYIADKIDENLLLRLFLRSIRSPVHGNRTIQASFTSLYLGRVHDLLPIMQEKFPELGLVEEDCIEMSWIESILYFAGLRNESLDILLSRAPAGLFGSNYFKGKSDYVRQPIPFSPYGGALSTYSESETPFAHRAGNIFMIHYGVSWTRPGNSELERHMNWIRRLYSYMARYVSKNPRAAYFNYRDLDLGMNNQGNTSYEQASVWGLKYFGNNFNRLVRVKTKSKRNERGETVRLREPNPEGPPTPLSITTPGYTTQTRHSSIMTCPKASHPSSIATKAHHPGFDHKDRRTPLMIFFIVFLVKRRKGAYIDNKASGKGDEKDDGDSFRTWEEEERKPVLEGERAIKIG
ncbi:Berberine bridge enzyme-like 18 [Sesamum angolense]|uniref:Berberine bridge enzyme-like 18 n=1 Tax=Sesamum angolense TaxID=2727404 RepID=A0AAE1WTW2_9LAMI|nr:Berberine bridge enzyme-like 18 [Sesamum angolense]